MTDRYDSPWKDILDSHLPLFLAFFFPEAYAEIDWSRGWISLEKELRRIDPEAEAGPRIADKLFKVHLRDGKESFLLVHVEIQGDYEPEFSRRMFLYNIRIYNLHELPVMSLAVLTDSRAEWRPSHFGWAHGGCKMGFEFPIVKLEDYNERWEELEASRNPFAVVVMAHLKTKATRHDDQERLNWKTRLVRQLYDKGFSRDEVIDLFRFIDWVMRLPLGLEARFRDDVEKLEREKKVRYVTSIERLGRQEGLQLGLQQGLEKGRQEGLQEGRQEGLQEGRQEGLREGEARLLRHQLTRRHAKLPAWVDEKLARASREELERWGERLLDAASLEDVFRS